MDDFKKYANSFQAKSRLGLESIGRLCEKFQNPQDKLKFIHVAGTNGKGSVCAFLQCILTESGRKTGKYISPNMLDVCERISVDGKNITENEMNALLDEVGKAAAEVERETGAMPTQFEIWTAAAFIYFEKQNCDIVVLETGLGGRLDATNIIKAPLCSVITKIDIDHIDYLGGTLEKIAGEKAGIIKKNSPVVTVNQKERVMEVLKEYAKRNESYFFIADTPKNHRQDSMSEIFDLNDIKNLRINLSGLHQTENAALAAEVALFMDIEEKYVLSGLDKARNMGRFEKLSENPCTIFDGAHNLSGTQALINALERYFPEEKLTIIYGAMADKDIDASLTLFKEHGFCDRARVFTVTVEDNPRAQRADVLADMFSAMGFKVSSFENIGKAYDEAVKQGNTVVICGSLYLYKDLKKYL